jgi:small subunit ribosomal protein S6
METRQYKATFIINLRETKRPIAEVTNFLKETLTAVGGKVEAVEDIGVRDFIRVTHKQNPSGHYVAITFSASGDINSAVQQKLKLEKEVKRTFIEAVAAA